MEVGLVREAGDVGGVGTESSDAELGASVALGLDVALLAGSVTDGHRRAVLRGEVAGQTRVDDVAGLFEGDVVLLGELLDVLVALGADDLGGCLLYTSDAADE